MQGKKQLTPKMLYQVHLTDLIPEHNYYRLLDKSIDFHFLYKVTAQYHGEEGQESIDPVIFFKICLVAMTSEWSKCGAKQLNLYWVHSLTLPI
jgi:transposase